MSEIHLAYAELKKHRKSLTRQQTRTLAGQIKAGNIVAAMKGLEKILKRQGA